MPPSSVWTRRFCERWLEKAAAYDEYTLDGTFDKFFSVFVAFNRLYTHFNTCSPRPKRGDKQQATDGVLHAIGVDALFRALTNDCGDRDLHEILQLVGPGARFYLVSNTNRDAG